MLEKEFRRSHLVCNSTSIEPSITLLGSVLPSEELRLVDEEQEMKSVWQCIWAMSFTSRGRLHVAAILRRTHKCSLLSSSPTSPSLHAQRSRSFSQLRAVSGPPFEFAQLWGGCLYPSHGGVLGNPTWVRRFSWWRWGVVNSVPDSVSNSTAQLDNGEGEAVVEASARLPSSTFRQEDEVVAGESVHESFPSAGDDREQLGLGRGNLQLDDGVASVDTNGAIAEDAGGSMFWSTLQIPTDAIIVTLDRFQNFSGVPWYVSPFPSSFLNYLGY